LGTRIFAPAFAYYIDSIFLFFILLKNEKKLARLVELHLKKQKQKKIPNFFVKKRQNIIMYLQVKFVFG
jgi:hypothetical protein